jgi:transcriptional regulator with XRE-family HTH domain
MTLAAILVREARRGRELGGITQRELARRSGLAQPAIAAVESGRKDATSTTLERIFEATGTQVVLAPSRYLTAARAARLIADELADGAGHEALRTWVQLANDLDSAEDALKVVLTFVRPETTGEQRYDTLIAAVVEHRLRSRRLPIPAWTRSAELACQPEWYVAGIPGLEDDARAHTPPAFLRHGIIIHEVDLQSV